MPNTKTSAQRYNNKLDNIFDHAFFLEYTNNYLTVAKIAEAHNIPEHEAIARIARGKAINEKIAKKAKAKYQVK